MSAIMGDLISKYNLGQDLTDDEMVIVTTYWHNAVSMIESNLGLFGGKILQQCKHELAKCDVELINRKDNHAR